MSVLSGDVQLRKFGGGNVSYISAGIGLDVSAGVRIRGRNSTGASVIHIDVDPEAKTLQTTSSDITYDGNTMHHDGDEEDWIAPTLLNNWVNFGPGWATAGYRKSANGDVHVRLMVKDGTLGTSVFTLPAGYRPDATRVLAGTANGGTAARWDIDTDGSVTIVTGGSTVFSALECVFRP